MWGLVLALGLLLLATALTLQVHAAPPADPPPPAWTIVNSPNAGEPTLLKAVAARTSNDVWAVGQHFSPDNSPTATVTPSGTFIQHWDGSAWSSVSAPNPGNRNELNAVAVRAANDAWAVGGYNTTNTDGPNWRPLILHWNGSTWSQVVSPELPDNNILYGVTVVDANNAWAVGTWGYYLGSQPCIYHWDGTSWSIAYQANSFPYGAHLTSIAARTVNDVWAVGDEGVTSGTTVPLTLHWNGSNWQVLPSLSPVYGAQYILHSVAMVASNDVWAVGSAASGGSTSPLTIHWNGTSWSIITQPGGSSKPLYGVAAIGTSDVWEAGFSAPAGTRGTLTVHWDGTALSDQASPNQPGDDTLYGVAGVATNDVWAVGNYSPTANQWQTLTLHYTAATPTITPTATPISTPPTYTVSYYIQRTNANAAQSLGCTVRDQDVHGIVVLDFGRPYDFASPGGAHIYGAMLPDISSPILLWPPSSGGSGGDSLPVDDIYDDALTFVKGYALGCGPVPILNPNMNLTIAIGASNSYFVDSSGTHQPNPYLTFDLGRDWAQMVAAVNDELSWLHYQPMLSAVGAYDAEPGWSWKWDYVPTYEWAHGYSVYADASIWHAPLYDFGSCDGCVRSQPRNAWSAANITELKQVSELSGGLARTVALPEIYKPPLAEEWYNVRRIVAESGKWMDIAGVMTECGSSGCNFQNLALWVDPQFNCGSGYPCKDFPPRQGWQALYDIHNAPCTPDSIIHPILSLPLQCSQFPTPNNIPPPHINFLTDIRKQP